VTEAQARARRTRCYPSQEEAQQNCKEKETADKRCWVCINGRVGQVTEAQARERGVKCYDSREEALRNCRGEGPAGGPSPRTRGRNRP
jgi:hypothetical protein